MKYYGLLLLSIWLIAGGLQDLTKLHFMYDKIIFACIALAAGMLLLLYELKTKFESTGTLLLGIWLIIGAGMTLFKFSFPSSQMVLAILAALSGLLLIVRK